VFILLMLPSIISMKYITSISSIAMQEIMEKLLRPREILPGIVRRGLSLFHGGERSGALFRPRAVLKFFQHRLRVQHVEADLFGGVFQSCQYQIG